MCQAEEPGSVRSDVPASLLLERLATRGEQLWISDRVSCGLVNLQGALLRQYFRLEEVERSLLAGTPRTVAKPPAPPRRDARKTQRLLEQERQRLGRELHTGVGQMLAAMRLQLDAISQQLHEPPEAVRGALERLSLLVQEAIARVRGLSHRLHPPEWQRLRIEEAVRQLWDLSGIPQSLEGSLRIEALPEQPDLPIKVLVYRTVQEALSNLIRHAKATRVEAVLEGRDGKLRFTIRDNGVGFDVAARRDAPANVAAGIGLRSIQEQAASFGAQLDIESGGGGTTLILSAPFSSD